MLRRGFLKLLGAAIAVPIIGGRAKRWVQRIAPIGHSLSKWNLWIGGDDGTFGDSRRWSHGRAPVDGDCIALDTGRMTVPGTINLEGLALIGPGHIEVEANPANVPCINNLTITEAARAAGCTIGKQGRTL